MPPDACDCHAGVATVLRPLVCLCGAGASGGNACGGQESPTEPERAAGLLWSTYL